MNMFQQIAHFLTQIESVVRHWQWWTPGIIGVSIILLPLIMFWPLNFRFQSLYDDFIIHFSFTAAGYGLVSLYVLYAVVHFDTFLSGLVIIAIFIEAFVFAGYGLIMILVSISDFFEDKRRKEYEERMQRLRTLGASGLSEGDKWR